jgi:hypothetical protein
MGTVDYRGGDNSGGLWSRQKAPEAGVPVDPTLSPARGRAWSGEVFVLSRTPLAPHEGLLGRNDRSSAGHRRRRRHGA